MISCKFRHLITVSIYCVLILLSLKGPAVPGKGEASDEDDDNEFFDAMEEAPEFITVPAEPHFHKWVLFHFTCAFLSWAVTQTLSLTFTCEDTS